ncbi:MAG TPA: hypothetical protein VKY73_04520 [Polyangiaceae bacterium]|nr:hypothetical protein [Polyangiaceae bacterium]
MQTRRDWLVVVELGLVEENPAAGAAPRARMGTELLAESGCGSEIAALPGEAEA